MKLDCICLIVPFPFNNQLPKLFDPKTDFDMTGDGKNWFALLQLFFTRVFCPCGHHNNFASHKKLSLVLFNTFDPIKTLPEAIMHEKGVPMLCEDAPSQIPTVYTFPVTNVLGQVPLIPYYLDGQKHQTIPH